MTASVQRPAGVVSLAERVGAGAIGGFFAFGLVWSFQWLTTDLLGWKIALSDLERDVFGSIATELILPAIGAVIASYRPGLVVVVKRAAELSFVASAALLLSYTIGRLWSSIAWTDAVIEAASRLVSSTLVIALGLITTFALLAQLVRAMARYDPLERVEAWTLAGPLMKDELEDEPEVFDLSEALDKWSEMYAGEGGESSNDTTWR